MKLFAAFFLVQFSVAYALDLVSAVSAYPELSAFAALLRNRGNLIPSQAGEKLTILAPNNNAFTHYKLQTGKDLATINEDDLRNLLQYHSLTGTLAAADFKKQGGLIVGTLLQNPTYDLRNAANGVKPGQVVYISQLKGSTVRIRQVNSDTNLVQSGAGNQVNLQVVDGGWDGGLFQIIGDVLTLPISCSDTFDVKGLRSLQTSLTRANLTDTLNNLPDVVCLAPNDNAFHQAGNPDVSASPETLADALKFHTIAGPGYTTNLTSGKILSSVNNQKVLVTILGDGTIFFNDAKVIGSNVIVKNGVVHLLDKVMSPYGSFDPKSLGSASTTTSASASPTSTKTSSGSPEIAIEIKFIMSLVLAIVTMVLI